MEEVTFHLPNIPHAYFTKAVSEAVNLVREEPSTDPVTSIPVATVQSVFFPPTIHSLALLPSSLVLGLGTRAWPFSPKTESVLGSPVFGS